MRTSSLLPANVASTQLRTLSFYLLTFLLILLSSCSTTKAEPISSSHDPSLAASEQALMIGAFTYGGVWHGMDPIFELESTIGQKLSIVQWFMNWDHRWNTRLVTSASQHGRLPLIAWQPHNQSVTDIANGVHDDYILSWAHGAADFGSPIYLRPFPEMNGHWTSWNGNPEMMVAAWQRMVNIFDEAGAHNVKWVWSPNITDEPAMQRNRMELYYPGEDYVDILAMDGYNWGTSRIWSEWTSFEDTFAEAYGRIASLGEQPIWITEVASAEVGGNKGQWITEMFNSTAFERLEAIIWFNENKEADWRIDSSSSVLSAFREGLSSGLAIASVE